MILGRIKWIFGPLIAKFYDGNIEWIDKIFKRREITKLESLGMRTRL